MDHGCCAEGEADLIVAKRLNLSLAAARDLWRQARSESRGISWSYCSAPCGSALPGFLDVSAQRQVNLVELHRFCDEYLAMLKPAHASDDPRPEPESKAKPASALSPEQAGARRALWLKIGPDGSAPKLAEAEEFISRWLLDHNHGTRAESTIRLWAKDALAPFEAD
jgi:hypothetical protein